MPSGAFTRFPYCRRDLAPGDSHQIAPSVSFGACQRTGSEARTRFSWRAVEVHGFAARCGSRFLAGERLRVPCRYRQWRSRSPDPAERGGSARPVGSHPCSPVRFTSGRHPKYSQRWNEIPALRLREYDIKPGSGNANGRVPETFGFSSPHPQAP